MVNENSQTGTIRFEVDDISYLTETARWSKEVEVGGMKWRINAAKRPGKKGKWYLYSHLFALDNASNMWSVEVSAEFKLVCNSSRQGYKFEKLRYDSEKGQGFPMIEWEELMADGKGFKINDRTIIECKFSLTNQMGIRRTPTFDFTDKNEARHDGELEIDGEKLYVSKQILALHSPYFDSLFYGDFKEKKRKIIEIKDVDRKEFVEMLNVIYPTQAPISSANYRYLLKLGDRFDIKLVLDRVEEYLISTNDLKVAEKLKLCDDFRLVKLHNVCLSSFTSIGAITAIKNTVEYSNLSDKAKAALLDRAMKLSH